MICQFTVFVGIVVYAQTVKYEALFSTHLGRLVTIIVIVWHGTLVDSKSVPLHTCIASTIVTIPSNLRLNCNITFLMIPTKESVMMSKTTKSP